MRDTNEAEADALEMMVDACGLRELLLTLSGIADAKCSHIEANWQDEELASRWNDAALALRKLADSEPVTRVG